MQKEKRETQQHHFEMQQRQIEELAKEKQWLKDRLK
jgi:hypothetical protein